MSPAPLIGGAPVVRLRAADTPAEGPAFLEAEVLPGRGMMMLQARLRLPSGEVVDALHAPLLDEAARVLSGGPGDFNGNASFSFGGAILIPYANRIRGRRVEGARQIETTVDGHRLRLPRNWGATPARDDYAMHGLILDRAFHIEASAPDRVAGRLAAGDFGCGWPGSADIRVEWRLASGRLELEVEVANAGSDPLPLGVGWHPYFALPSRDRRQARLSLAARERVEVDNYQAVLPTGRLLPVGGTPYDVSGAEGAPLGGAYLDDCFTGLAHTDDRVEVRLIDPAAGLALRVASPTPEVRAVQVFAPPREAFVVIEPQTNLADPYGAEWRGLDTGMVRIAPGRTFTYAASVEPQAL